MKPASLLLLLAVGALLGIGTPRSNRGDGRTTDSPQPDGDLRSTARRTTGNLAAWVNHMRAESRQPDSGMCRSAGNLWIEVDRLKRAGQNVRQLEWYVSDLERNLRGGGQNPQARRQILNNVEYEIDALNRRLRR